LYFLGFLMALAQSDGGAAPAETSEQAPFFAQLIKSPMFPIMMIMIVIIIITTRSKRSQEKQRLAMLGQVKRGDRIQTIGGILGKVVETETDKVLVKVDESSNTKIWFARRAIDRVMQPEGEKAEAK